MHVEMTSLLQRRFDLHFHVLLNIDTTSKMKHGNEMDFQTLKRRRIMDVETTIHRR